MHFLELFWPTIEGYKGGSSGGSRGSISRGRSISRENNIRHVNPTIHSFGSRSPKNIGYNNRYNNRHYGNNYYEGGSGGGSYWPYWWDLNYWFYPDYDYPVYSYDPYIDYPSNNIIEYNLKTNESEYDDSKSNSIQEINYENNNSQFMNPINILFFVILILIVLILLFALIKQI